MDGTETRSLSTDPEVSTKVNVVSQIICRFRAFISCCIRNNPPRITMIPTLFHPSFSNHLLWLYTVDPNIGGNSIIVYNWTRSSHLKWPGSNDRLPYRGTEIYINLRKYCIYVLREPYARPRTSKLAALAMKNRQHIHMSSISKPCHSQMIQRSLLCRTVALHPM